MNFPSPIAFYLGPWPVRWYGLAYGAGMVLAWLYGRACIRRGKFPMLQPEMLDHFMNWALAGVVIGGRLGDVLLYRASYYVDYPLNIFKVWEGGMSFHGGLVGALIAAWWYCRKNTIQIQSFLDCWAIGVPIGLFFGRIANFINQELCGRVTTSQWGILFPKAGPFLRHPSQLYEAFFEGFILFLILNVVLWVRNPPPGRVSALFLVNYGWMRFCIEFFREPEGQWGLLSVGQLYTLPIIVVGLILWILSCRKKR